MAATDLDSVVGSKRDGDRTFYTVAAIVAVAAVLAGFARTYYARSLFVNRADLPLMLHVHGLVMTAWIVMFVTQIRLVATQRTPLHRKLGVYGGWLAALVVIVGTVTAISTAAAGRAPPGVPPLVFLTVPLGDVALFTMLIAAALWMRKKPEYHKRLMLSATFGILTAAIARWPIDFLDQYGLPAFFALTDVLLIVFIAADTWRHRRLHPAFAWGLGLVVLSQVVRFAIAGTPQWLAFAKWLTT